MKQTLQELDPFQDVSNPLDSVEEVFFNNDWVFERPHEDEISVSVAGDMGVLRMHFVWQEDYSAMQFTCTFEDLTIPEPRLGETAIAISAINSHLWLGHFDLCPNDRTPRFRHTSLFRGATETSGIEQTEDLIDIAVNECERYYSAFSLLSKAEKTDHTHLSLAMMDSIGQA